MKEFLYTLLTSLNNIEVKGKSNMDILLGCIVAVENKIEELSADESTPGPIIDEQEVNDNG